MRVIQLFPKTTPAADDPQIGVGAQSLVRGVLGTAPVEADGSVYCEVPAGIPLYFQALDERGRAVQTMRSDTYVHPGELLLCVGCHEDKQKALPVTTAATPLAMGRPPSILKPEVEEDLVSFLRSWCSRCWMRIVWIAMQRRRLRQVWPETTLENGDGPKSYQTLAPFAWAKHGGNGALAKNKTSYSIAGEVGALGSTLLPILDGEHYGVTLSEAERHRITLWLDSNSVFYGAYHDAEKQAKGETVMLAGIGGPMGQRACFHVPIAAVRSLIADAFPVLPSACGLGRNTSSRSGFHYRFTPGAGAGGPDVSGG